MSPPGSVAEAFAAVREQFPGVPVEVEVDSLEQLDAVVAAGADLVLLDNFTPDQMTRPCAGPWTGTARSIRWVDVGDAPAVAATGVDYVAVGAERLTHSAPVLDIGADLQSISPTSH